MNCFAKFGCFMSYGGGDVAIFKCQVISRAQRINSPNQQFFFILMNYPAKFGVDRVHGNGDITFYFSYRTFSFLQFAPPMSAMFVRKRGLSTYYTELVSNN